LKGHDAGGLDVVLERFTVEPVLRATKPLARSRWKHTNNNPLVELAVGCETEAAIETSAQRRAIPELDAVTYDPRRQRAAAELGLRRAIVWTAKVTVPPVEDNVDGSQPDSERVTLTGSTTLDLAWPPSSEPQGTSGTVSAASRTFARRIDVRVT
jgi:hypothetical protein